MRRSQSQRRRTVRLVHAACVLNVFFTALWLVALLVSAGRLPGGLVCGLAAFVPLALANIVLDCLAVSRLRRGQGGRPYRTRVTDPRVGTGVHFSPAAKR